MRNCDQTKLICPAIQDAGAEIASLRAQLASARKALEEIKEFAADHVRIDWCFSIHKIADSALKDST